MGKGVVTYWLIEEKNRNSETSCDYRPVCSILSPTPAEALMIISGQKQIYRIGSSVPSS